MGVFNIHCMKQIDLNSLRENYMSLGPAYLKSIFSDHVRQKLVSLGVDVHDWEYCYYNSTSKPVGNHLEVIKWTNYQLENRERVKELISSGGLSALADYLGVLTSNAWQTLKKHGYTEDEIHKWQILSRPWDELSSYERKLKFVQSLTDPLFVEELRELWCHGGILAIAQHYNVSNAARYLRENYIDFSAWAKYKASNRGSRYRSRVEYEIVESLSLHVKVLPNVRLFKFNPADSNKFELDGYIPVKGIAYEINGAVYHASSFPTNSLGFYTWSKASPKDKYYHARKTTICNNNCVKLYQFWVYNSHSNSECEKIRAFLLAKVGQVDTLYARKLRVVSISFSERKEFFNRYHFDGDARAFVQYALIDSKSIIYSVISFRKHPEGIEIARFATKAGYRVVGGFSRLLKHVVSDLDYHGTIITYCNRDICPDYRDSVYYKNGFTFLGDSGPILTYVAFKRSGPFKPECPIRRQDVQKHKLEHLFGDTLLPGESADTYLVRHNILPCYNSGNWKFKLEV